MPGGDGSIVIDVTADDKEAQRKLSQLRRDIEKTAKALDTTNTNKNAIADQLKEARTEAQKLEAELANVTKQREEAAAKMSANAPGRSKFAAVDPAEYFAARETYVQLGQEQERLNAELTTANKNVATLESQEGKVLAKLEAQTEQLRQQKEQAGSIERVLAQRSAAPEAAQAVGAVSTAMRKGVRSILRWGFGIRSAFMLLRRLKSGLIEGVKAFAEQDEETQASITGLKAALSTLKGAWGAAFAPILNAVAPILERLIALLTAAANAISALFAIISGGGTYKKTIQNNDALADSYSGAGGAAADAKKEIMGFDEINKLNDNSGGGGGGDAAKTMQYIEEAVDNLNDTFLGRLGIAIKDVFFEWGDINPEQIAKKVIVGLTGLLGAALGISLGLGFGGTLLLTIGGVVLGLIFSALTFNNNGKLDKSEILKMVILAINAFLGGVLGFAMTGSFKGAMIGATIGVGLTLAVQGLKLSKGDNPFNRATTPLLMTIINGIVGAGIVFNLTKSFPGAILGAVIGVGLTLGIMAMKLKAEKTEAFYESELGQQVQAIKDKVAHVLEVDEDLKIRINSITGEVDDQTLVNLGAAQKLINEIFNLDAIDNKTPEQVELLKQKIEALNELKLEGITASFDDTTGHVTQTRQEVQGLLGDLLHQYEMEAMKEAYIESYKAQYEATQNVAEATTAATDAQNALDTATTNLTTAQENYNTALANWNTYKEQWSGFWDGGYDETQDPVYQELQNASTALDKAKTAFEETKGAATDAKTELSNALTTYDTASEKVETLGAALVDLKDSAKTSGEDTMSGFASGIDDNAGKAEDAIIEAGKAVLSGLDDTMGIASPSKETMKDGEDTMAGFAIGIQNKQGDVITAIKSAMNAALAVVQDSVNAMIRVWRSDWGRPMIHLPVFGLAGMFDFRTGQTPQVVVRDWIWAAKGGIVDGATLIGAGEAGKEAIVPLERNTEWINLVADGLIRKITQSNALADYISGMNLPAIATGQIVPPRALNGGGSMFSDGDIDRLVSGISAALTGGDGSGEQTIKLFLDGKQIAETVTKHQRRMERGFA